MTVQELEQAKELDRKIKSLDSFLFTVRKAPKLGILKRGMRWLLKTSQYGHLESAEYDLDKEFRDEILHLSEGRLQTLKDDLSNIGNKPKLMEGN